MEHVIVPAIIPALLPASVLAWNDGWTFDVAAEFVQFGANVYSVTGLGSYIQYTFQNRQVAAAWFGVLVMGEIIFITNQLIWHRLHGKGISTQTSLCKHAP